MKSLTVIFCVLVTLLLVSSPLSADTMDDEIDYLIRSIGTDGCRFIRNGQRFTSRDARAYLRSKLRHNAKLIHTTQDFIEKIASESVTTGKPYLIRCTGEEAQPLGEWFTALLAEYRGTR